MLKSRHAPAGRPIAGERTHQPADTFLPWSVSACRSVAACKQMWSTVHTSYKHEDRESPSRKVAPSGVSTQRTQRTQRTWGHTSQPSHSHCLPPPAQSASRFSVAQLCMLGGKGAEAEVQIEIEQVRSKGEEEFKQKRRPSFNFCADPHIDSAIALTHHLHHLQYTSPALCPHERAYLPRALQESSPALSTSPSWRR